MLVNIEHEDVSLSPTEGLEVAAGVLLDAARRAGIAGAPGRSLSAGPGSIELVPVVSTVPEGLGEGGAFERLPLTGRSRTAPRAPAPVASTLPSW